MALTGLFPIENSDLYKFYSAEREAIEVHKYYLGTQLKFDPGWQYAEWDWVIRGWRDKWLKQVKESGVNPRISCHFCRSSKTNNICPL